MKRLGSLTARLRPMLLALPLGIGAMATPAPADAPPNTERARPDSPHSDALVDRLIIAKAAAPSIETPPEATLELLDTTHSANFDSGSDELTPSARARLDQLVAILRDRHPQRIW